MSLTGLQSTHTAHYSSVGQETEGFFFNNHPALNRRGLVESLNEKVEL